MSGAMSCFKVIIEKKNHPEIHIIKFQRGKYQIGACATISSSCILFWHYISCIYFPQRHRKSACPTRFYYVLSEHNILHTHISHWRIMAFLCVWMSFSRCSILSHHHEIMVILKMLFEIFFFFSNSTHVSSIYACMYVARTVHYSEFHFI